MKTATKQLIWSASAVKAWRDDRVNRNVLAQRISNLTDAAAETFIARLRPGTPYVLLDGGKVVDMSTEA